MNKFTEFVYEFLKYIKSSLNIFIDFSNASDTINHHILLKKLELYGIRGNALYVFTQTLCVYFMRLYIYTEVPLYALKIVPILI